MIACYWSKFCGGAGDLGSSVQLQSAEMIRGMSTMPRSRPTVGIDSIARPINGHTEIFVSLFLFSAAFDYRRICQPYGNWKIDLQPWILFAILVSYPLCPSRGSSNHFCWRSCSHDTAGGDKISWNSPACMALKITHTATIQSKWSWMPRMYIYHL